MKIAKILIVCLFTASMFGCATSSTKISEKEYEITAHGNMLMFLAGGCGVANERYGSEALKSCPNGYDQIGDRREDVGGRDNPGWCFYKGNVKCRDAATSELIK